MIIIHNKTHSSIVEILEASPFLPHLNFCHLHVLFLHQVCCLTNRYEKKTMIMVSVVFIGKNYPHLSIIDSLFFNEIILYSIPNEWLKFSKYFHKELFSLYDVELLINLKKFDCYFCIIGCIWRNNKDTKIINYLVKMIFFAKYITFIQNFFAQRKSCSKF